MHKPKTHFTFHNKPSATDSYCQQGSLDCGTPSPLLSLHTLDPFHPLLHLWHTNWHFKALINFIGWGLSIYVPLLEWIIIVVNKDNVLYLFVTIDGTVYYL